MNHPGTIKARQHYLFLQRELRNAGFDVYVHENRFFDGANWISKAPSEIISSSNPVRAVHRSGFRHGQLNHGQVFNDKIANSVYADIDRVFNVGNNYKSTFFIGGLTLGDFANVQQNRELEFRQLVLKIKPTQSAGYIFINYI